MASHRVLKRIFRRLIGWCRNRHTRFERVRMLGHLTDFIHSQDFPSVTLPGNGFISPAFAMRKDFDGGASATKFNPLISGANKICLVFPSSVLQMSDVRFSNRALLSSSMGFRRLLSALRGSRFSTWSALRWVQVATSIGRIGLESLAMARALFAWAEVRSGSEAEVANHDPDVR